MLHIKHISDKIWEFLFISYVKRKLRVFRETGNYNW